MAPTRSFLADLYDVVSAQYGDNFFYFVAQKFLQVFVCQVAAV